MAHAFGTWDGLEGDYNVATNWDDDTVPAAADVVTISSGTATISENLTRDADTTLDGTGELVINGRLINAANGPATLTVSDDATLTHDGHYFLVANQNTGSVVQTGGTVNSTVSRGWFLSDGGSSKGSYSLSGGSLNVNTSASNGVHMGKNSSEDRFTVSGGTATFTATTGNMRTYVSKGAILQVDSGSAAFNNFKYFVVGRDFADGTVSQIIINGGSFTVGNVEAGGAMAIGNKNNAQVTLNGGVMTVQGDIWVGDADPNIDPKVNGTFIQNGGTLNVNYIVLSHAAGSEGTYLMTDGVLNALGIMLGDGGLGLFDFQGGDIFLAGDQTGILDELWFQEIEGTIATYDLDSDLTHIAVIPEPSTYALILMGGALGGTLLLRRRRRDSSAA